MSRMERWASAPTGSSLQRHAQWLASALAVAGFDVIGEAASIAANAGELDLVVVPYTSQNLIWLGDGWEPESGTRGLTGLERHWPHTAGSLRFQQ